MIKTIVLQSVKNEQKISKNGRNYTACSIKVADKFINGFGNEQTKGWEAGQQVTIDIYQEEYNGKQYYKFKTLDKADLLESRVKKLEDIVFNKITTTTTSTKQPVNTSPSPLEVTDDAIEEELLDLPF